MAHITRRQFMKQALLTGGSLPFLLTACRNAGSPKIRRQAKVIVLGIDGLDPHLTGRMMRAGELPHLTRLAGSGAFLPLATSNPPQSPVAWSSMATGNNPGRHGLFDFLIRDPATYLPEMGILSRGNGLLPSTAFRNPRQCPALWEILAEADIPVTVIRWPVTFPPADISGKMLAGLGVPDIKGELGASAFYTTRAAGTAAGQESAVLMDFVGDRAETRIDGPLVRGAGDTRPAAVTLVIKRMPGRKQVQLDIQGTRFLLDERSWSPWVRVTFPINLFKSVSGICRFFLQRADQPLALYLSPIQIDPADPCFPISTPPSYAADLARGLGAFHTQGIPEDTKALMDGHLDEDAFLQMCDTIMREQEDIFYHELENYDHGLLANVFYTTDRIQHIFWGAMDPGHPAFQAAYAARYGDVIRQYYRRMDGHVGAALKKADDQTLLIVCSDHGFSSFRRAVHLNSWLADRGYMRLFSRPDPGDAEGGPLFRYVDWAGTRAYALGLGGVYLNLKGREKQGLVEPAACRKVLENLRQDLTRWVDQESGQGVVRSARTAGELFRGPCLAQAPDLIVGFNRGFRVSWQSALGGTPPMMIEANLGKWTGDHCVDPSLVPGVFFANRKTGRKTCSVLDIAPTILTCFGLRPSMDGRALL